MSLASIQRNGMCGRRTHRPHRSDAFYARRT